MSKSLMIDPGHGGTDPGATAFGVQEKDWTLKMSLYQYKRLKELGANVDITRQTDQTLGSTERTRKIRSQYDYCMSNHFNSYNGSARGVETIHSIYASDKTARTLSNVITAVSGLPFRRVFDKKNSRGSDWYYMHRLTGTTQTTIVEYGFLDHDGDFHFYASEDNFFKVAEAVVETWCELLGVAYEPPADKQDDKQSASELWKVQVGAFSEKDNANQLAKKLEKDGYKTWVTRS